MRLTEAYMALGIVPEAQTSAAVLGHNFPDSRWYKDAYALVQSGPAAEREQGVLDQPGIQARIARGCSSAPAAFPGIAAICYVAKGMRIRA